MGHLLSRIDWDGPAVTGNDTDSVEIPITTNPLTTQQLSELRQTVDPLEQCDDLGVSLYVITRTLVRVCI